MVLRKNVFSQRNDENYLSAVALVTGKEEKIFKRLSISLSIHLYILFWFIASAIIGDFRYRLN